MNGRPPWSDGLGPVEVERHAQIMGGGGRGADGWHPDLRRHLARTPLPWERSAPAPLQREISRWIAGRRPSAGGAR